MAILIDKLLNVQCKIGRIWYVSKPIKNPFKMRLKDAWGVLTGRYEAVKFAEEEKEKDPTWKKETRILSELDIERMKEAWRMNPIFKHIIDDYITMGQDTSSAIEHAQIDFDKLPEKIKKPKHNLKFECPTCHDSLTVARD